MHSDFFSATAGDGRAWRPVPRALSLTGALLGSAEQKAKLFTGNRAASELAPSLGAQNTLK